MTIKKVKEYTQCYVRKGNLHAVLLLDPKEAVVGRNVKAIEQEWEVVAAYNRFPILIES